MSFSLGRLGAERVPYAGALILRGVMVLAAKLVPVATLSCEFLHRNGRFRPSYSISCKTQLVALSRCQGRRSTSSPAGRSSASISEHGRL
jgi:hypothetical protein